MNESPRFSVLIPSRNRLELLQHAIESVRRQTFDDWEIVVSDNASEPGYEEYVRTLDDARIRCIRSDIPLSVTENWNRSLANARGEYVVMLGDDDALAPGYFEAQTEIIEKFGKPEVVYSMAFHYAYPEVVPGHSRGYFATMNNSPLFDVDAMPYLLQIANARSIGQMALRFRHEVSFNAQHFLYRRTFIEELRRYGEFYQSPYPDYYCCFVTFLRARSIVIDPRPRIIIGISSRSFGYFFLNNREQEGSSQFLAPRLDESTLADGDQNVSRALEMPGTVHTRNWLIAALFAKRALAPEQSVDIYLRRYIRVQIFDLAQRSAYERGVAHKEFWSALKHVDNSGQRFGKQMYRLFLTMKRVKTVERPLVSWGIRELLHQYAPPKMTFHDIGQHSNIVDAIKWLEAPATNNENHAGNGDVVPEKSDSPIQTVSQPLHCFAPLPKQNRISSMVAELKILLRNKRLLLRLISRRFRGHKPTDFDKSWYLKAYPDVRMAGKAPLLHFLRAGIHEGRSPNAYARHFDRTWYLKTYADVAESSVDPLDHFVRKGAAEGRAPNANLKGFDADWYLHSYPDIKESGQIPLLHFLRDGMDEGRAPNAYAQSFDADWYLKTYPDVAKAGLNPLEHFLEHGAAEGRAPRADLRTFDAAWYVRTYPDVEASGQFPILHYMKQGRAEGRSPNALAHNFDPGWYLETYADVARARLDPLQHYLEHGISEGRFPNAAARATAREGKNKNLNAIAADLLNAGEIGAAAVLELARDQSNAAANRFLPFRPLNVIVDEGRGMAAKLQILLPSVKKEHATGGPNTAFMLGVLLAQRGIRVGFISTSTPPDSDLGAISSHLKTLTGFRPEQFSIEFADASDPNNPLRVGHNDVFLATAWWTAQAAHSVLSGTHSNRFYYLIQDFEPLFHAASENWCQALETYAFDHVPIINTTLLRDFLRDEAIGRFADSDFADKALAFEPAVDHTHFHAATRSRNAPRRLLFYARPTIAQRNLFGMGVAALKAAVTAGLFGDGGWEFLGIGEHFDAVPLGRGFTLAPAPWLNFEGYAAQMRGADVLLSLMLSPHPSYPPLEMAACGGTVVTTVFGSKTAERLADLSPNIIGVEPSVKSLAWGLQRAIRRSDDTRAIAPPLGLPSTWQQSMAPILPRLLEELAKDGILPVGLAKELPPVDTSTALALYGDDGAFYRERRSACRELYRPSATPGLISLVTTVYDTDPAQLADLAHSIFAQDSSTDFEWVLLDNGSSRPETLAMLQRLQADPRVRFGRVADNLGIIRGMRWCLEHAQGRYIVPVDSDDLLFPHSLRAMCAFIEQTGFPPILYTDEDKTDGERQLHLYAKPDWDPVLFIHSCFIAHVTAIDRQRALELNCYGDSAADGSHDWDTFVRFLIHGHTPMHLAEPLYTWRMHAGSTSSNYRSKDYIYQSQKFVLQNYLAGRSLQNTYGVELSPIFGGTPDWRFVPLADPDAAWLASLVISSTPTGGVLSAANIDALKALPAAVTHVHLESKDCTLIGSDWAAEAKTLIDLFPDTVMVGGRIHDGNSIREAGYVFGYGGMIGCADIGRSLNDPGYFAQMWKPRSVAAVSVRHCIVRRDFLAEALREITGDVDVGTLGLWLGALARERSARVVYTPFLEARVDADAAAPGPQPDLATLTARFGHLVHDRTGYAPRLDRSGQHPYAPGNAEAAHALPAYEHYLADHIEQRQHRRKVSVNAAPISVLTTVYQKTDAALFRETAECVAAQTTRPLEWIVLAHGPVAAELDRTLDSLSQAGAIRLLRLQTNLGIAGGLRHCLEAAQGEFVLALDADDLLEVDAMASLTDAITSDPAADIFYSDEDLLIGGSPRHPYARPDFDPALLCAHSYVWHAIAFRRATGLALGAFTNLGAEYAQDWDVLLRFMWAGCTPVHLPEVLYHWRQHDHSLSHSGHVFEGSLASIRHLLGDVANATGNPHLYEVQPYPHRIGEIDYYIRRRPIDSPAVLRLDIGDRDGRPVCHEVTAAFPFASQASIPAERGRTALEALEAALGASDAELVLLLSAGVTLMDEQGLWQAIKQLELLPQALGVGGPLIDIGGIVRFGPVVETPDGRLTDPARGKPLVDAGPFSLALKPHCVTMVTPDLLLARRAPLLEALRAAPAAATLRGLGPWLGLHCRRQRQYLVYEPLLCAGIGDASAQVGDPLEALSNHWRWLAPLAEGMRRPIQGLSGFAWHASHHA